MVLAEVDETPRGHTDSAEVGVSAKAQANDVAACAVPVCSEGEGRKGGREEAGVRGSVQVKTALGRKKLDIFEFEWCRVGALTGAFSESEGNGEVRCEDCDHYMEQDLVGGGFDPVGRWVFSRRM